MARYRLSEPAKADIAAILRSSEERYGLKASIRCRALQPDLIEIVRVLHEHMEPSRHIGPEPNKKLGED